MANLPPAADASAAAVATTLQQAIAHHRRGALAAAEALYREILARVPEHFDALHLLGVVWYANGRHDGTLTDLRARLARNRESCPLFDTDRFRQHFETALVEMFERHVRGEPPAAFAVAPVA
jgi:thioredoxin-like negative regulator of GroEL